MSTEELILEGPPVGEIPDCSLGEFIVSKLRSLPQDRIIHVGNMQKVLDIKREVLKGFVYVQVDANSGASQSVGEYLTRSIRLSEGLKNLGLKENDVVGMICRNCLEANEIVLGTWLSAAAVAPILGSMTVGELKHSLDIVEPKFIFCEEEAINNLTQTLKLLSTPPTVILVGNTKKSQDGYIPYEEVFVDVDESRYKPQTVEFPSKQLVAIYFSSGTSGLPKAVGISHKCLILQCLKMEPLPFFDPEMSILQVSQYFWVTATLMLLSTIISGLQRVMLKEATVPNILKAIEKYKVDTTFIAPSLALTLCTSPDFDKYELSSMKVVSLGGSPFTPNMGEKFKEKWKGVTFVQSYGATELAGSISSFHESKDPYSVGKLSPGVQAKIVDVTTGKALKANNIGEIMVKAAEVMVGYLKNEKATKDVLEEDGWFHTGDLGYFDDSGHIYLVDRLKEMIKVMNMQVSPTEVENVILSLPGVAEVCVTGVTRDGSSQEVMALVVKKENSNVTKEDILAHVSNSLSEYKVPKAGIYFLDSLPKTQSGKVRRKAVRDLAQEMFSKQ